MNLFKVWVAAYDNSDCCAIKKCKIKLPTALVFLDEP